MIKNDNIDAEISINMNPLNPKALYKPIPNVGDRIDEIEVAVWVKELSFCILFVFTSS